MLIVFIAQFVSWAKIIYNMKIWHIFCLLLLRFLLCSGKRCRRSIKPLRITVLYESLCSDSKNFFLKFWPVFKEYHECINLTLVPYGKATRNGDSITCQHGPNECWGNLMQNCALHTNINQLQKMQFVNCQMQDLKKPANKDFKCAESLHINAGVKQCMKTIGKFTKYQNDAERITNRYAFSEIPAIIFNGVFDESLQSAVRSNVRQTLCEILVESKHLSPDEC